MVDTRHARPYSRPVKWEHFTHELNIAAGALIWTASFIGLLGLLMVLFLV